MGIKNAKRARSYDEACAIEPQLPASSARGELKNPKLGDGSDGGDDGSHDKSHKKLGGARAAIMTGSPEEQKSVMGKQKA